AVEAYKTEPAQNPILAKYPRQGLLVAQAILQCDDRGMGVDQRGNQFGKAAICRGFEPDKDCITTADLMGITGASRPGVEISLRAPNSDAAAPDHFIVRPKQKMHFVPVFAESGPVISPEGSTPHDSNF